MSAPFTLILETTTPHASLAVVREDGGIATREFQSDRHHNAMLFGPLAGLLAGVAVESIGRVLVGSGPGSYSGTRVGIAAAQGVALAAGCPAVAVPSLVAVPAAAGHCLFLGDARRGSFWTARVEAGRLVAEPALTDAAGLAAQVGAALAAGDTVATLEEVARFDLLGELGREIRHEVPTAAGLWQAWQRADEAERAGWAALPPQPIYLKPPHITAPKRPWLVPS